MFFLKLWMVFDLKWMDFYEVFIARLSINDEDGRSSEVTLPLLFNPFLPSVFGT